VIRPLDGEKFEIAARIPVQGWTDLLRISAQPR